MFDGPGRFYKGNLHTHSTRSDGVLDPQEVCRRYRERGYDFLALTDHFVGRFDYPITDTSPFRTDDFITILGAELHSGATDCGELWHILAVGLPSDFAPSNTPEFKPIADQETGPQIAKRALDAGAFVAIAHPHWSALTQNDVTSIESAHAVEIYNTGCDVDCDRGYGFIALEHLLDKGRRLSLCATDDAHFATDDAFGGWVMVKAGENSPEALLEALKAGRYYASQGPDFHDIVWSTDSVTVRSSPVSSVILQAPGIPTAVEHGDGLVDTTIGLGRCAGAPWLRITLIDADRRRAWSQPYWRMDDGSYAAAAG
ncbi:MAG: CehA/McbA family metallohydrolase [Ahrensia sp.]|nr:CehA/McbA family metallohydrolase [Ahrensia sp.]